MQTHTAPRLGWGLRLQARVGTVASPTLVSCYSVIVHMVHRVKEAINSLCPQGNGRSLQNPRDQNKHESCQAPASRLPPTFADEMAPKEPSSSGA